MHTGAEFSDSADSDQSQLAQEKLERYRAKLLDLSGRNPLVSFKHSARSKRQLRVVDELPDVLFERLESKKRLAFKPIPLQDTEPPDEKTAEFRKAVLTARRSDVAFLEARRALGLRPLQSDVRQIEDQLRDRIRESLGMPPVSRRRIPVVSEAAIAAGIRPDFELPLRQDPPQPNHSDQFIQTLLYPKDLEARVGTMYEAIRLEDSEKGINTFHAAFGFLEWGPSTSSAERFFSPLFLYPCDIEKEAVRSAFSYFVVSRDQDPVANLPLIERLKNDFGILLPSPAENEGESEKPDDYLKRIASAVEHMTDWKIHRFITFGVFSFAKLAMYHDLNALAWQGSRFPSSLIETLLLGSAQKAELNADRELDVDEYRKELPLHVKSADSSQLKAIIDASTGRNLVIEGPPGTGKSQTITNIIAACLANNKTVLFVAEKMAALEVVKKRLDESGLGEFCLELHSSKARKTEVLESLKKRLETSQERPISGLDKLHERLFDLIGQLDSHSNAVNTPINESGITLTQAIGRYLILTSKLEGENIELRPLPWNGASSLTPVTITDIGEAAVIVGRSASVLGSPRQIDRHPWQSFAKPYMDFVAQEELIGKVERMARDVHEIRRQLGRISPVFDALKSYRDTIRLLDAITVNKVRPDFPSDVASQISHEPGRQAADTFIEATKEMRKASAAIARYGVIESEVQEEWVARLKTLAERAREFNSSNELSKLFVEIDEIDKITAVLANSERTFAQVQLDLKLSVPLTGRDLSVIQRLYLRTKLLTDRQQQVATSVLCSRLTPDELAELRTRAHSISERLAKSDAILFLDEILDESEVVRHFEVLKSANAFSYFTGTYWKARSRSRSVLRNQKLRESQLVDSLRVLTKAWRDNQALKADPKMVACFGENSKGHGERFDDAASVLSWSKDIGQQLDPSIEFDAHLGLCLQNGAGTLIELSLLIGKVLDNFKGISCDALIAESSEAIEDLIRSLRRRGELLKDIQRLAEELRLRSSLTMKDLGDLLAEAERYSEAETRKNNVPGSSIFKRFVGPQSKNLVDLELALALANAAAQLGLTPELVNSLFSIRELSSKTDPDSESHQLDERLRVFTDQLADTFSSGKGEDLISLRTIENTLERTLAVRHELPSYIHYLEAKENLGKWQLTDAVDQWERSGCDFAEFSTFIDWVVTRSLIILALSSEKSHVGFSGEAHAEVIRAFRDLDSNMIGRYRQFLRTKLSNRIIPTGVGRGKAGDYTELSLIKREMAKSRRHIPLRLLLKRAENAIRIIKPCFMMSPLSVASFLHPSQSKFDVLIMDEASQLKPEDALGAIQRTHQVVVVGDSQQLPPTNFFDTSADDATHSDDDSSSEGYESILNLAHTWPSRRLLWHYRSRHESLIAFSNYHFYDEELVVPPSPLKPNRQLGLHFLDVQGIYGNRRNLAEAEHIVAAFEEEIKLSMDRSIGIVTMNQEQQDLIETILDERRHSNPTILAFEAKWQLTVEPFFVKNLENVQGDERDIILISTVYGKDSDGNFRLNFGPINRATGHRRLNVLFTRARTKTAVFSSIDPDWIPESDGSKPGLRALKGFLTYAKTGSLGKSIRPIVIDRETNEFEEAVQKAIESQGLRVTPQVGVAGFYIDLGIWHPDIPGKFILGVECDGATYHSSKFARDRDRIRQEILENLGWKIHRIWSLDWFREPKRQVEAIVRLVENLKKAA